MTSSPDLRTEKENFRTYTEAKCKYKPFGNGSENFRLGMHTYLFLIIIFLEKNISLGILKGEMPFKMHKIIFFLENAFQNA